MFRAIEREGLEVGQWIQFSTTEDLSNSESEVKAIYQENQRFLVISREDAPLDDCRCNVIDIDGKIYDYCARMFSLGFTNLSWDGKIRAVTRESVEVILGKEKVEAVYQAAEKHLEKRADYFAKYPAQLLGQSKLSRQRKLNEVLEEQASKNGNITPFLALSIALSDKAD